MLKLKINTLHFILFLICCTLAPSCKHSKGKTCLQEGDLLFQNLNCGDLCDAIETVTEGVDGKDFSHCAMVVNINDTLKVIEAIGKQVQVNTIDKFISRSGDTTLVKNIAVGRLKKAYENLIPNAASTAKQLVGQPYDDEFIINNGKWYCSELIYEAFKKANNQNDFFELEPMTYKDPKTNSFFPAWVDYYKKLNTDIPQGKPGTNPGLISRSNKIQIIKVNSFNNINCQ
jgi:hypothetical protein